MMKQLKNIFGIRRRKRYRAVPPAALGRVVFAEPCPVALRTCLAQDMQLRHEGIAYLYGSTDGDMTLVVGAIRPDARTTPGSFEVSAIAMARVVRKINDAGLHLVGQAHSHPGQAFHSDGDEIGARIAYQGFVSIVLPDYGYRLPSFDGAAAYIFRDGSFHELAHDAVSVVSSVLI